MKNYIITFAKSETANNKVDDKKLSAQIHASPIPDVFVCMKQVSGDIYVEYATMPDASSLAILQAVIEAHDGEESPYLDRSLRSERRDKILHLIADADYAGLPIGSMISYRTSIDNEINGWVDTGINDILIAKIDSDAIDNSGDFYNFLNIPLPNGGIVADFFKASVA